MDRNHPHLEDLYFRSIFENPFYGIVITGPDFKFQQVNSAFCKLLEYGEEELVGKKGIGDVTYPQDLPASKELLGKLIRREIDHFVIEKRYITKSGRIINALNFSQGIYDNAGRYISGTASILDITDRKQAEDELRKHHDHLEELIKARTSELESKNAKLAEEISERKRVEKALSNGEKRFKTLSIELETILDHIPAIIFSKDLNNRYLHVNKFLADAQHTSKENLIGKSMVDLFPKEEAQAYWDADLRVARSGKPLLNIEEPWTTPEGKKWVSTSKIPIYDENENVYAILGMGVEITERKRAEEALRESEARLKDAQELGRIGNWEFDFATKKITWSDQTYRLFGRDPTLGPPSAEEEGQYYPKDQVQKTREYARLAAEEGRSFKYDLDAKLPNGKQVFFSATMQPIKDAQGRVVKLFGTIQDITERKKIEQEGQMLLEKTLQISDLKSNLITQAAHELKTPLTAILGWGELLFNAKKQGKSLDTTFDIEDFEIIMRNAERLNDIINDFLDVGRIESGKFVINKQDIDFNEIIENATSAVDYLANQKNITFSTETAPKISIPVDRRRMEQVLINLLSNAIKYSPEHTQVLIKTRPMELGGRKLFEVRIIDEGYGFTNEELAEAMTPFGKAYTIQEKKRVVQGTGLGLFISLRIVEEHGGTLVIKSEGANKGTQVEILLPLS